MKPHIKPTIGGGYECRSQGVVGYGRSGPDAYRDWCKLSRSHAESVAKQILAWRGRTA